MGEHTVSRGKGALFAGKECECCHCWAWCSLNVSYIQHSWQCSSDHLTSPLLFSLAIQSTDASDYYSLLLSFLSIFFSYFEALLLDTDTYTCTLFFSIWISHFSLGNAHSLEVYILWFSVAPAAFLCSQLAWCIFVHPFTFTLFIPDQAWAGPNSSSNLYKQVAQTPVSPNTVALTPLSRSHPGVMWGSWQTAKRREESPSFC